MSSDPCSSTCGEFEKVLLRRHHSDPLVALRNE